MKILNFEDFCALPEGAIFSYYEPSICTGLCRKGRTILHQGKPIDFFETYLWPQCWNGDAPIVDDIESRWGEFQYDQLFAVLEENDIQVIRNMLDAPK